MTNCETIMFSKNIHNVNDNIYSPENEFPKFAILAISGKWHDTPTTDTGPEGPFYRWSVGDMMGFDRYCGFMGGDCNQ